MMCGVARVKWLSCFACGASLNGIMAHCDACRDPCCVVCLRAAKVVLVEGPETGVSRHLMPLKRLSITNIKCDILPGARLTSLKKVNPQQQNPAVARPCLDFAAAAQQF